MTIGGAISDLNNLLNADDIPFYYKPSIKKVIETIEQEPKIGHWIKSRDCYGNYHFTCPFCEHDIATKYADTWEDNYCSNCGAKMVKPQESEEG